MLHPTAGPRTDIDLDHFHELLDEERDRIMHQLRRIVAQEKTGGPRGETEDLSDYDQHMADQATETFLREQDQAIHLALRTELDQVEAAQRKMASGTYGYCDRCGTVIPEERLEILPFALFCMPCSSEIQGRL